MNLVKGSLLVLLSFLCNDAAISNLRFTALTHASADPLPYNTLSQNTESNMPPLSSLGRLEKAQQLLLTGKQQYQSGKYSDAEETLRNALDLLNSEQSHSIFQNPKTRTYGTSIDIFGIFVYKDQRTSSPSFSKIEIPKPLDEIYEATISSLALGKDPDLIYSQIISQSIDELRSILGQTSESKPRVRNPKTYTSLSKEKIQNIKDIHNIELKILQFLQQSLVAQNQDSKTEQALEFAESARNLELLRISPAIAYALNFAVQQGKLTNEGLRDFTPPDKQSIGDIKGIAERSNATLVYYSMVSDKEALAWVIKPNGEMNVRKIKVDIENSTLVETINSTLRATASFIDRGQQAKSLILDVRNLRSNTLFEDTEEKIRKRYLISESDQREKLQTLHKVLINPVNDLLPTNPDDHVVFIPQSSLLLTPFPALLDSSGKYLIDRHTIRVAPNLQSLAYGHNFLKKFPKGQEILIVGNPTTENVLPLPGAEQEANFLGRLTNSFPLTRNQATPQAVSQFIGNAKVLHFATHGVYNIVPPPQDIMLLIRQGAESSFVQYIKGIASPNNRENRVFYSLWPTNDGKGIWHVIRTNGSLPGAVALTNSWFTSQNMLNLKLNADLVVLSACNTAKGIATEETLLGIPLSLSLAGVHRVVVSLWSVPDIPTKDLMIEFYSAMNIQDLERKEIDEAKALRQAMLKVKSKPRYSDPINWAGFIVLDVSRR